MLITHSNIFKSLDHNRAVSRPKRGNASSVLPAGWSLVSNGWTLIGLLALSHGERVDTHWCVKDLVVANRGAQIPADVERQVSVT